MNGSVGQFMHCTASAPPLAAQLVDRLCLLFHRGFPVLHSCLWFIHVILPSDSWFEVWSLKHLAVLSTRV